MSLSFVLTEDAVRAVYESGKPIVSFPVTYDLKEYYVEAGRLDDAQRFVIWFQPRGRLIDKVKSPGAGHLMVVAFGQLAIPHLPGVWDPPETRSSYVLEYDAGGREIHRHTIPPLPDAEPALAQSLYGLVTPLAGVILHGGASLYYFPPAGGLNIDMKNGVVPTLAALMLLSAAVCALLCFMLARRYSFSRARRIGWLLCGFLWGPYGVLLMFALQEWPARIVCHRCGRPRVVTREGCEHCGAPHIVPAPDGTEVFESTAATPLAVLSGS
jgi:hypothetical protein